MEFLAIVGLIAAVVHLWRRLDAVEAKLTELEWRPSEEAFSSPIADAPLPREETPSEAPHLSSARQVPDIPALVPSWEPVAASDDEPPAEEPTEARSGYSLPRLTFDFEDIFGRRLPIWAGGIALAVAGIFMVRFSIEAGLLTPAVRVLLSFVFGMLLLAGAEAAYRFESRIRDPRVRQALAGAGLATLYAGFYLAGSRYGLIASGASFLGLAAVTAAAIVLSFRFGLPCAVLGLIGGFAAPALVASEEANVPILTLYLALVAAGLTLTGQRQGRPWLGYGALAFGFLWGTAILVSPLEAIGDLAALGLYLVLLGAAVPLLGGAGPRWPRLAAAGLASLQMAALIDVAGYQPLTWGLYLLLGAALAALGWREPRLREASAFAAALGLWMLSYWQAAPGLPAEAPAAETFAWVAAVFAAIFVGVPLTQIVLARAGRLELWQVSLAAPALAAVAYQHFGAWDSAGPEPVLAAVALALAVPPALAARNEWIRGTDERQLTIPLASAAALVFAALLMVVPAWAAPVVAMAVSWALVRLMHRRPFAPLSNLAWAAALIGVLTLGATPEFLAESQRLGGIPAEAERVRAVLRWLAAGLPFFGLAWLDFRSIGRRAAEAVLALAIYGALAQVLPEDWLAWAAALGALAVLARSPDRAGGWALALAVAALWSAAPLAEWLRVGFLSLGGEPMLIGGVPSWREALLRLLPLVVAAAFAAWRLREESRTGALWLAALSALAGCVTAHLVYKQLFAIATVDQFVRLGLAERTVWQALLTAGALLVAARTRSAAAVLLGLSLAHFTWFGLLLHNPLWDAQAVGAWPAVNWLLPAYGVAAIGVIAARRLMQDKIVHVAALADGVLMVLIAFLALSELRQAFAGSLLIAAPVSQQEDLLRSLLGIVLALLYLAWGSRTARRSWRIGSLVLMLLAVGKVFLVDAAGLEGLLRIASFMALGFSLIGIGWVYSRQLRARPALVPE